MSEGGVRDRERLDLWVQTLRDEGLQYRQVREWRMFKNVFTVKEELPKRLVRYILKFRIRMGVEGESFGRNKNRYR